ncbi:lyase family protein [Arthrobacter sp. A5]|uniref:lyase family protein n=1 Tax=Arthrobacter sp. A5 TaxID=576926 RepID=UPI003DA9E824
MADAGQLHDGGDFGLLSPAWAGTQVAALTGDQAFLQAMLDVELAWVRIQARVGLVPAALVEMVARAALAGNYDAASLAERAQQGGNPLIPLLADLRAAVAGESPEAAAAIHRGATSQDIVDTALLLMSQRAIAVIETDLRNAARALARMASEHRRTLMAARTLTQHSLPSTFGLKAAQWLAAVGESGEKLDDVTAALPLQWGGAAGTMAALTALADQRTAPADSCAAPADAQAAPADTRAALADKQERVDGGPLTWTSALAAELGLADPLAPWQTNRLPVTALGHALSDVLAAAGKIANDVLLLSRPEIAEVSEPLSASRGVSSAMPQKQNPVLSVLIRSAALAAPGHLAQLQAAAGAAIDERPDGSWHVEWQALRQLLRLAGGAAAKLAELADGLRIHTAALGTNLLLGGELLLSERIMLQVAPLLDDGTAGAGRKRIQAMVSSALADGAPALIDLLRDAVPRDVLSDQDLAALLDPSGYLGQNDTLIDRIDRRYSKWAQA